MKITLQNRSSNTKGKWSTAGARKQNGSGRWLAAGTPQENKRGDEEKLARRRRAKGTLSGNEEKVARRRRPRKKKCKNKENYQKFWTRTFEFVSKAFLKIWGLALVCE